MSRKSTIKRTLPRKEKKSDGPVSQLPIIEEENLVEEEQLFMDKIRPHIGTICLVGIALVLCVVAIQFWQSANFQTEAIKWVELNQAKAINAATGEVKELNRVADSNPDSRVGLISAMYAADSQLRSGIYQLGRDREGGLGLVKKAKDNLKTVLDADDRLKTPWLSQRAQFSYAYACETLGEFETAKAAYKEIVDNAPDSPLFQKSQRGLTRVSDEKFVALYQKFKDYESSIGEAPGPLGNKSERPGAGLDAFSGMDIEPGKKPPVESPLDPKSEDKKDPAEEGDKESDKKESESSADGDVKPEKTDEKKDDTSEDKSSGDMKKPEQAEAKSESSKKAEDAKKAEDSKGNATKKDATEGAKKTKAEKVEAKKEEPETPKKQNKPTKSDG